MNNKLIVILGPTSSGKTGLSIKLAKKFNGEIVSADSRQVYKGMDIGTGKVTKKEMQGIPHYLLDVASPKKRFDAAQYKVLADRAIDKIFKKNKTPFLVGGTGFYIQSITDGIVIPSVKPNWKLREKLGKIALPLLLKRLYKLDPKRAGIIDQNNPRRIIRALEIAIKLNGSAPSASPQKPDFGVLFLGIRKEKEELKRLIYKRLSKRLKQGMVKEVEGLHGPVNGYPGVSFKRLEELGLEYRYVAQYLQEKISYPEMIDKIQKESEHYAKRQMTWFKRDKRIYWIQNQKEAEKLIKKFL